MILHLKKEEYDRYLSIQGKVCIGRSDVYTDKATLMFCPPGHFRCSPQWVGYIRPIYVVDSTRRRWSLHSKMQTHNRAGRGRVSLIVFDFATQCTYMVLYTCPTRFNPKALCELTTAHSQIDRPYPDPSQYTYSSTESSSSVSGTHSTQYISALRR